MLIATWNVNGVRARAERLREWLTERKPDIVCLQELKVKESELERETFEALGYQAAIVGQPGWNGVGVLARERPETLVKQLPGAEDAGARFLSVRVSGIEVTSVYVPNGKTKTDPDFQTKLAWLERLAVHVESRRDRDAPLVVAGDFNVCLTDLDSYLGERGRGAIFHTDEERSLVGRLAKAGMVDLFRAKHPDDPGYSWWDYRAGAFHKKLGMRLDLLWATEAVARRVKDVVVDREFRKKSKTSGAVPSDHAPVVATLD